ncbi:MAG TPA: hypothetical protein ENI23_02425 [bacterium]|nr:hypothetical protein [bacterium]
MKIKIISRSTTKELIDQVRKVPLLEDKDVFVYKDSNISIKDFYADELNIPKLTFIKSNLGRIKRLRENFLDQHKLDILQLDSILTYRDEKRKVWTMIPPIVELVTKNVNYIPRNKKELDPDREFKDIRMTVLGDGAHRGYVARELGLRLKVIFVSGADPNYPYYAYPNDWSEAEIVSSAESKSKRKFFVWEDKYKLYRNFGAISTGGVRKAGSTGY